MFTILGSICHCLTSDRLHLAFYLGNKKSLREPMATPCSSASATAHSPDSFLSLRGWLFSLTLY